jgi:hypothetical protein
MRDPKERLRDILEAVARIDQYAAQGCAAFEREELNLGLPSSSDWRNGHLVHFF